MVSSVIPSVPRARIAPEHQEHHGSRGLSPRSARQCGWSVAVSAEAPPRALRPHARADGPGSSYTRTAPTIVSAHADAPQPNGPRNQFDGWTVVEVDSRCLRGRAPRDVRMNRGPSACAGHPCTAVRMARMFPRSTKRSERVVASLRCQVGGCSVHAQSSDPCVRPHRATRMNRRSSSRKDRSGVRSARTRADGPCPSSCARMPIVRSPRPLRGWSDFRQRPGRHADPRPCADGPPQIEYVTDVGSQIASAARARGWPGFGHARRGASGRSLPDGPSALIVVVLPTLLPAAACADDPSLPTAER